MSTEYRFNSEVKNTFISFLKENKFKIIILIVALSVYAYTLNIEISKRNHFNALEQAGEFLAINKMKVNDQGRIEKDGSITLSKSGVMFGPYIDYEKGNYIFEIHSILDGKQAPLTLSITSDSGDNQISQLKIHNGENRFNVHLKNDVKNIEFTLRNDVFNRVEVKNIKFYKGVLSNLGTASEQVLEGTTDTTSLSDSIKKGGDLLPKMLVNKYAQNDSRSLFLKHKGQIYGPYIDLNSGSYRLNIHGDFSGSDGKQMVRLTGENGKETILEKELKSGDNVLPFKLKNDTKGFEITLINEVFNYVKIDKILLYSDN